MRVLLVNRALPCHITGGLERHFEDLALGLAARGLHPHLLTAPIPEEERERLATLGVTHHAVPVADASRYSLRYLREVAAALDRLLAVERFDVIHAQEFALGFWRPRRSSPPVILSVHGTITSETPLHRDCRRLLRPGQWPWAVARFGRRLAFAPLWRRHLHTAARILVDSEFTRRDLDRDFPATRGIVRCIPLAVREAPTAHVERGDARRALGWTGTQLLTIGRVEWQKGQDLAIEALAGLRDLDWHYTIVGEGSAREEFEALVRRLGLERRVTLTGRVDDPLKRCMLMGADLFVWPERTHPAFGLAGLEAMLYDLPVLATARGAMPEVLGSRGGWLVEQPTAEALHAALEPLLRDPLAIAARRDGLRRRALHVFDFERMVDAVLAQYRAVTRTMPGGCRP